MDAYNFVIKYVQGLASKGITTCAVAYASLSCNNNNVRSPLQSAVSGRGDCYMKAGFPRIMPYLIGKGRSVCAVLGQNRIFASENSRQNSRSYAPSDCRSVTTAVSAEGKLRQFWGRQILPRNCGRFFGG